MMYRTLLIGLFLILGYTAHAQVNPHAIGVRIGGDGDFSGAEISYQHGLNQRNRMEFDVGWGGNKNYNRIYLAAAYHWDWNITGGLNWYLGPGATVGLYSGDDRNDYATFGILGQIGLEYDFNHVNAPILLSLDFRPVWDIIGDNSGLGWGLALGIRYTW